MVNSGRICRAYLIRLPGCSRYSFRRLLMTGGSLGALYQPAELVIIAVQGLGRLSSAIMAKRLKAR